MLRTRSYFSIFHPIHSSQVELVKLIAGHGAPVNARSNGGYTPLHLAFIQGHRQVVEILVGVYHADPDVRDHAGKLPRDHNAALAAELGDGFGGGMARTTKTTTTTTTSSSSGLSRWVGLRSSGSKSETKFGSKSGKVERRESKVERGGGEAKAEEKGKEKADEKRRAKPKKTPSFKGLGGSPVEKTTQVTFV